MTSRIEKRRRLQGRRTGNSFLSIPHHVLDHENFRCLSPRATKLAIDIAAQYRGNNNGDLCATMSVMQSRGWTSSDQLAKAKKELLEKDVIWIARQGGYPKKASLYALTWIPIDDCKGKLDINPTNTPPVNWKKKVLSPPLGAKEP